MISFANDIQIWITKENPSTAGENMDFTLLSKLNATMSILGEIAKGNTKHKALGVVLLNLSLGMHEGLIGPDLEKGKQRYIPIRTATISVQKAVGVGWWASRRAMFKVKRAVKMMGGEAPEVRFVNGADFFYLGA